jgi:hypothetical protein
MLKDKKVGVEHLIYIIIIFTILISFSLVIHFGGIKNADNIVGVASTVSSIILAVIAIVMSLIDVAGQRQSIVDLKETAESLTKTNTQSQNVLLDITLKLEEINTLRDILINQSNENANWRNEITAIVQKLDDSNIKSELESKLHKEPKASINLARIGSNSIREIIKSTNLLKVKEFINQNYNVGEGENVTNLVSKIGQELGIKNSDIHKALNDLSNQGFLFLHPGGHITFNNY